MTRGVIAFGSNVGNREQNIQDALDQLQRHVQIVKVSSVYETAPMYVLDQPSFLNGVVSVETTMGPLPLMLILKEIEAHVGRHAGIRNGPREIDLDLLLYGDLRYSFHKTGKTVLEVPHPRMTERLFVLQPLLDIDPDLMIPDHGSVKMLVDTTEWSSEHVVEKHHAELSVQRI